MYILCRWPRCIGIRGRGTIGGYGTWGFDYLNVDTCSKRLKVGHDELLICWGSGRWQELCELGETESGKHRCEVGIMGKVEVEGLV